MIHNKKDETKMSKYIDSNKEKSYNRHIIHKIKLNDKKVINISRKVNVESFPDLQKIPRNGHTLESLIYENVNNNTEIQNFEQKQSETSKKMLPKNKSIVFPQIMNIFPTLLTNEKEKLKTNKTKKTNKDIYSYYNSSSNHKNLIKKKDFLENYEQKPKESGKVYIRNVSSLNSNKSLNTSKGNEKAKKIITKDFLEQFILTEKDKPCPIILKEIKMIHHQNLSKQLTSNTKELRSKLLTSSISSSNCGDSNDYLQEKKFLEKKTKEIKNIRNLLNSMNSTNTLNTLNYINKKQEVKILSSNIFYQAHPSYNESITSSLKDIIKKGKLKAFAYNTSMGNIKDYNEDTISIEKLKLGIDDKNLEAFDSFFFGIFDGHGGCGCSSFLKENLYKEIKEFSVISLIKATQKVEDDFLQKNIQYNNSDDNFIDSSGSCAIIALIKDNKLLIANVGDSRLVLFKNHRVDFMTTDHKPINEIEKQRIISNGGKIYQSPPIIISQNGHEISSPWRVFPGRLSVSRTFGDIEAKIEKFGGIKNVIIAKPDIYEFDLTNDYSFMVLGCDGIFDVLSNEELIECTRIVVNEYKHKEKIFGNTLIGCNIHDLCGDICGMIIKSALIKESFDNLSCIVIIFDLRSILSL